MLSKKTIISAKDAGVSDNKVASDAPADSSTANTLGRSMRLGKCEVCAASTARYCCPKCEVKTCCLRCVQIHKRELKCDGIRNRTKFVPLNKITTREFMSDYCFLEDCTRYTEARKRDRIKQHTHGHSLPLPQYRMREAARERGTQLKLLAPHFSRHKENTSYLDWKQNCFYWRVCWVFNNATLQLKDARCNEQQTLAALLLKYIDRQQEPARTHHKLLRDYQSAGIGQLQALLRAEGVRSSQTRFHRLELQKTLRENLAGKTIIEFPTIYVLYEQQLWGYDIVDSDECAEEDEPAAVVEDASKRKLNAPAQKKPKLSKAEDAANDDVYAGIAAAYNNDAAEHEDSSSTDTELLQQPASDLELNDCY